MKKILGLLTILAMVFTLGACGKRGGIPETGTPTQTVKPTNTATTTDQSDQIAITTIDALALGSDYKDLSAELRFLTHRTDIMDTKLAGYVTEFQKLYPNIKITYEAVPYYNEDMMVRLATGDWGDICMIPTTLLKEELPSYFQVLGDYNGIAKAYDLSQHYTYEGQVYGICSAIETLGIFYNKRVFTAAGITTLPKTPKEYLDTLQKIKDGTEAVPLYTNFAEGWTMGEWDAYIGGTATGDPDFLNQVLPHAKDPFADRGNGTGPYAVYEILYEAVSRGLVEEDPITAEWEASLGMLNRGEIGTMVLGSWAYPLLRDAGDDPDSIGYMPFPITVNGKQYTSVSPDYGYGINNNSSDNNKIASMLYIKWLTEQSGFAIGEGGISIVQGEAKPETYSAFEGVEYIADNPPRAGEETLLADLNAASEVGINMDNSHVQRILESAVDQTESLDDIVEDWNSRWTDAQRKLGVTIEK